MQDACIKLDGYMGSCGAERGVNLLVGRKHPHASWRHQYPVLTVLIELPDCSSCVTNPLQLIQYWNIGHRIHLSEASLSFPQLTPSSRATQLAVHGQQLNRECGGVFGVAACPACRACRIPVRSRRYKGW